MAGTNQHRVSFEFFPPKTPAGIHKLEETRHTLGKLNPDYFSVTYGAGGSTRDNTKQIVLDGINAGFDTAPHLSFGGDNKEAILKGTVKTAEEYQVVSVTPEKVQWANGSIICAVPLGQDPYQALIDYIKEKGEFESFNSQLEKKLNDIINS